MQITINLDTDSASDLTALAALVASLGGRTVVTAPVAPSDDRPAVPTDAGAFAPHVTSDALIEQEAARAAGHPIGPSANGTGGPVFDSSGLPWDERIHGKSGDGTLPTNADGTWRKRRGVDDATVATVTAELRARGGAPTAKPGNAPETTPPPPVDTAPVSSAAISAAEAPAPPVAEAPTPPVATAAPVTSSGGRFNTFADFVTAVNGKGLTYAALNEMSAANFSIPEFRNLKDYPQHWDMFALLAGVE